jgi:hypothetical protein
MDKYRMFKNYMYNDLGITKEDIKQWTKEAVKEVALEYLLHHMSNCEIKNKANEGIDMYIKRTVPNIINDMVRENVNKIIFERFNITLIEKKGCENND